MGIVKQYLLLYISHTDPCDGCVVAAYEEMLSDILCSGLEETCVVVFGAVCCCRVAS